MHFVSLKSESSAMQTHVYGTSASVTIVLVFTYFLYPKLSLCSSPIGMERPVACTRCTKCPVVLCTSKCQYEDEEASYFALLSHIIKKKKDRLGGFAMVLYLIRANLATFWSNSCS